MLTSSLSQLAAEIEASAKELQILMALRELRRKDPDWKGCTFCFGVGCGVIGNDRWVPCPEHNGLCL